jgi:D-alanyl-D-alanine carboxypeptidase
MNMSLLHSLHVSALAMTALVSGTTTDVSLDDQALATQVEKHMDALAEAGEFSGALLVARGDTPLLRKSYGFASKRYDVKNLPDTKFSMGSMNKMFTGVAICQLVEEGYLSFETTIGEVLPDYPNEQAKEKVTVHHLLTHRSGIPSYWNEAYSQRWREIRTVVDLLSLFAMEPLNFEPGTGYEYSNGGPTVLGRMIEVLTGEDYYDYIRDHITAPLGMSDTASYESDQSIPNLAMGYTHHSSTGEESAEWLENAMVHTARGGPAGGGYSNVDDMLKFSLGLQEFKLLSEDMLQVYYDGGFDSDLVAGYGYLIGNHKERGLVERGHNGGAPGVSCDFGFYPDLGLTFVVLSNQDEGASGASSFIRQRIYELVSEESKTSK